MNKDISLSQEELSMIYEACRQYSDNLEGIIKTIPNGETDIKDLIANKIYKHDKLASKMLEYMEL